MIIFSAQNIEAGYGDKSVVNDVSFQLEQGQMMGILGANGSGKTTLLKALCGIIPHKGVSQLRGEMLEEKKDKELARVCSYIPQRSGISIDIPVLDVVLMGFNPYMKLLQYPDVHMKDKAIGMLKKVGLKGKEDMNYLHLSEGQKQMCVLARTLVADCNLLMLDEPESALDFQYRYQMLGLIREWVKENERGAIVTLHDSTLALNYCDKLLLLSEGKVLDVISPKRDSIEKMEALLSEIYGQVSLQYCKTKSGINRLVMIKEEE